MPDKHDPDKDYNDWLTHATAEYMSGETKTLDAFHDGAPRLLLEYAEQLLCAACLFSPKHIRMITAKVNADDFLPGPNPWRGIFQRILKVLASGKELNKVTLAQSLNDDTHLMNRALSLQCDEFLNGTVPVEYYIRLVSERRRKKQLYDLGIDTGEKSRNGCTSTEIVRHIQSRLNEISNDYEMSESSSISQMVDEHDKFVEKLDSGEFKTIRLPYSGLEDVVLYPGNQVVLGAHTSVGKSAFALNIAINLAESGRRVLWVTTEMTKIEMIQRICSCVAGIGVGVMRQRKLKLRDDLTVVEFKRRMKDSGGAFRIFYNSITTEIDILNELQEMELSGGCDALFVDYIQDMQSVQKFRDAKDRITYVTSWLRHQASKRGMVLFVISQLSRPGKEDRYTRRKPTLWDLKETGAIENKTEVVILLHRKDNTPNVRDWDINVEVAKNRNGNRCECEYLFDSWSAKWTR